jgi:hypothetical protein
MSKALLTLIVIFTCTVYSPLRAQTARSLKDGDVVQTTICKGLEIPDDYVITGEGVDSQCAKGAWVIRRKGARPVETSSAAGAASVYGSDDIRYDRFDDVTRVWSPEVLISQRWFEPYKPDELFVRAAFIYGGRKPVTPRSVALVFILRSSVNQTLGPGPVIVLADGERHFLETSYLTKQLESYYPIRPSDEMTFRPGVEGLKSLVSIHREYEARGWLPFSDLTEILDADHVEVRLASDKVIILDRGQRAALRAFINRTVPQ